MPSDLFASFSELLNIVSEVCLGGTVWRIFEGVGAPRDPLNPAFPKKSHRPRE